MGRRYRHHRRSALDSEDVLILRLLVCIVVGVVMEVTCRGHLSSSVIRNLLSKTRKRSKMKAEQNAKELRRSLGLKGMVDIELVATLWTWSFM